MTVACVVNTAVDLPAEAQLAARRIVGGLLGTAEVELLIAVAPAGPAWELGLPGRTFPASTPREVRRATLDPLLLGSHPDPACRCPDRDDTPIPPALQAAWTEATGGRSDPLVEHLASSSYECVVLLDLAAPTTVAATSVLPDTTRVVIVPLRAAPLLRLDGPRRALARADLVLTATVAEAEEWRALTTRPVEDAAIPLRVTVGSGRPPGVPDRPYVLVVADWCDAVLGTVRRREAGQLARRLASTEVDVVVLTEEYIVPARWPAPLLVRGGGSRSDLWRWMRDAIAVIDLERRREVGREALEAMSCAAPVVVPEGGRAHALVERCGGGFWYRNHADIVGAVQQLLRDPHLRSAVGEVGQRRTADLVGDVAGFGRRLAAAISSPQRVG